MKAIVRDVVKKIYRIIIELRKNNVSNDTCLIFPKKSNGDIRICEQELKQLFIEVFCREYGKNYSYSVETPTKCRYNFTNNSDPQKVEEPLGKSASIDLALHDKNGTRVCIIEFKAHHSTEFAYKKDFLKLHNEYLKDGVEAFFIQLIDSTNKATLQKLKDKKYITASDNTNIFTVVMQTDREGVYENKTIDKEI